MVSHRSYAQNFNVQLYYPLLKRPRNGPCHSETGVESMASFRLCMKEDTQNKNMSFSPSIELKLY